MFKNIIDCLQARGFIEAIAGEELRERANKPLKGYVGFDPSADSLHLGNLLGIMVLAWMQKFGHTPVVILGGATGRIGDPSGKSTERPFLDQKTIEDNVAAISRHFEKILDFSNPKTKPIIVNNDSWMAPYPFVDFLRDVGKHFRVNQMIAKEMVRNRLESEEGISFTEFSYQLLQAYDFHHLFVKHGVELQMGGSDQWGNITAGIDLVRKLDRAPVYGLTWPLLTRSDGKKFGKTEEGAIWLSPEKCSPYHFYQYLFRMPDADMPKMLRLLTFLDLEEIAALERSMQASDYRANTVQKRLAEEVTRIVHGQEGVETAIRVTEAAMPGARIELNVETLKSIAADMPHFELPRDEVVDQKLVDLLVKGALVASKGEATRLITSGGVYLNEERVEDPTLRISASQLIGGAYLLLGIGKKKKLLLQVK